MIIFKYLAVIITFYFVSLISHIIYGVLISKFFISKKNPQEIGINGWRLRIGAFFSTTLSFNLSYLVFLYFNLQLNIWVFSIALAVFWLWFTPKLYAPHYKTGNPHIGMLISLIMFLYQLS